MKRGLATSFAVVVSVLVCSAFADLRQADNVHPIIRKHLEKRAQTLMADPRLREMLATATMNGPDCSAEEFALATAQADVVAAQIAEGYAEVDLANCQAGRVPNTVEGTHSVLVK